jgi:hypothetical protein
MEAVSHSLSLARGQGKVDDGARLAWRDLKRIVEA